MPDRHRTRATSARMEGRRRASSMSRRIGLGLHDARTALRLSQEAASARAGIAQASWSRIERGASTSVSLETLASCAAAVEVQLAGFIEARPGSDLPRDLEHLRRQELVIELARGGGWSARPELAIDADARHSRSIDVHLGRRSDTEQAVVELEDLLNDGGAAFRNLADKVAAIRRASPPGTHVQGLLILRSTARNRSTLAEFPGLFRTRFPGSSQGWLRALIDTTAPLPDNDGLLWSTSRGDRLVAVRGLVEPGPRT